LNHLRWLAHSFPVESVINSQQKCETIRLGISYDVLRSKNQFVTFPGAGGTASDCISPKSLFVANIRVYGDDAQRVPRNTFDECLELHIHLTLWVLAHDLSSDSAHT
jgi:hypothetical protein